MAQGPVLLIVLLSCLAACVIAIPNDVQTEC